MRAAFHHSLAFIGLGLVLGIGSAGLGQAIWTHFAGRYQDAAQLISVISANTLLALVAAGVLLALSIALVSYGRYRGRWEEREAQFHVSRPGNYLTRV